MAYFNWFNVVFSVLIVTQCPWNQVLWQDEGLALFEQPPLLIIRKAVIDACLSGSEKGGVRQELAGLNQVV